MFNERSKGIDPRVFCPSIKHPQRDVSRQQSVAYWLAHLFADSTQTGLYCMIVAPWRRSQLAVNKSFSMPRIWYVRMISMRMMLIMMRVRVASLFKSHTVCMTSHSVLVSHPPSPCPHVTFRPPRRFPLTGATHGPTRWRRGFIILNFTWRGLTLFCSTLWLDLTWLGLAWLGLSWLDRTWPDLTGLT